MRGNDSDEFRRGAGRGVRRAHARHAQRRCPDGDGVGRAPDRALRRARRARRRDEQRARRGGRARRALRTRVAGSDDRRTDRRARPRERPLLVATRACRLAHPRGVAGQPRRRGAMDHVAVDGRGRHRRVLPEWRGCAVRAVRALPRGHGRGERPDGPLRARLAHPPSRPRHGRTPRGRRFAARSRLRSRPGAPPARRALPCEHVPRLRPLERGDRVRAACRRPSAASRTSRSSSAT